MGEELLALWDQIQAWVNDRTRPPRDRLRSPENARSVLDHVGWCAFLANFFAQEFPEDNGSVGSEEQSLRNWYRQHARQENNWGARLAFRRLLRDYLQKEYGSAAAQLEQYLTGVSNQKDAQDDLANLSRLATQLKIPRILLDAYLAPAALRAVIVRGADRTETDYGFDYIPDPDPDANKAKNAKYWLPARTLVNSDMSITLLAHAGKSRPKLSETDWNRHPGFEVLVPLSGNASVEYRGLDLSSLNHRCEVGSILVYRSAWSHRVQLSQDAQVLVMRFNIVDHKAIESFQDFATLLDRIKSDGDKQSKAVTDSETAVPANQSTLQSSKGSSTHGNSEIKLIAALTAHHEYESGSCLKYDPIALGKLAEQAGVSKATASNFIKEKFGSHKEYQRYCYDDRLVNSLKLMNNEISPKNAFGRTPPNEGNHELND